MSASSEPTNTESPFRPTWGRLLFAAGLALGGFFLPQEVPLEWYPLNEPGTDINYLEISCASNVNGEVQIRYDVGLLGNRSFDNIRIPISPTTQTFTYTFPLPDAPLVKMQVHLPAKGTLSVRQMRIINRRGEEIRRFTREMFHPLRQVAAINPTAEGWDLVALPDGFDPSFWIEMAPPITPVGMNHRNLLRSLLSTGYLAMMLLILLLAVLTATYRPKGWRDFFCHAGFMAALALLFAPVGNRGLIRNSLHYASFSPPTLPSGRSLEIDLHSSAPNTAQLYWDTGQDFAEAASLKRYYENHTGLQTFSFPLPPEPLRQLRFDPIVNEGQIEISNIRVVDTGRHTLVRLPAGSLVPGNEIATVVAKDGHTLIKTTPGSQDPTTLFTAQAVDLINQAK